MGNLKKLILIIDDEEVIAKSVQHKLKNHYDTVICNDGQEAVEYLYQHKPDLIVSDIMMPYMSGIELLDKVKNGLQETTPVILMSSLDEVEIINVALDIGADDFIVKPINMDELLIRIKRVFEKVENEVLKFR